MKQCSKCGAQKEPALFSPDRRSKDGLQAGCKTCAATAKREYRAEHPEREQKAHKKYREAHLEACTNAVREWRKKNPDVVLRHTVKYQRAHPERVRAHRAVCNALKRGELVRLPCEVCGATKVDAHHPDYEQPLVVIWLCRQCHTYAHETPSYSELTAAAAL